MTKKRGRPTTAATGKTKAKRPSGRKVAQASVVSKRQIPWGTIGAVVVVLALAGVVFGYYLVQSAPKREQQAQREELAAAFQPTSKNQDPSKKIDGVVIKTYDSRGHVSAPQRVAYDQSPPFGGPHDGIWADCTGVVYDQPVRTENMIHPLEHGAVWIAYNADELDEDAVRTLEVRVKNKPYTMLSPYPGLDRPISVQSWGHQLKVDDADDQRIDNFIAAPRNNQYTTPEANATCKPQPGSFDVGNPPPFDRANRARTPCQ